jgi:hypothetical protein
VTSSSLLRKSWNVITSRHVDIGVGLSWKVYKEPNTDVTIIAFEDIPSDSFILQSELVSSTQLKEKNFLHFEFLCTKANSCVSLNNTAVSLFYKNYERLHLLKSEVHLFSNS